MEETTNSEFIQQFLRTNITFTDDDIQNWMSCDGSGYEHMDEQGIVALISGDNEKEVEDENDVPQSSKCPFSHGDATQKMDDYLALLSLSTRSNTRKCITTCSIP